MTMTDSGDANPADQRRPRTPDLLRIDRLPPSNSRRHRSGNPGHGTTTDAGAPIRLPPLGHRGSWRASDICPRVWRRRERVCSRGPHPTDHEEVSGSPAASIRPRSPQSPQIAERRRDEGHDGTEQLPSPRSARARPTPRRRLKPSGDRRQELFAGRASGETVHGASSG
jgi:hypothetical protein